MKRGAYKQYHGAEYTDAVMARVEADIKKWEGLLSYADISRLMGYHPNRIAQLKTQAITKENMLEFMRLLDSVEEHLEKIFKR